MATGPGQRFVRRHNAARGATANATASDIAYDTAVISEGGYSWASPEVSVDEAGLYLTIFDIGQVDVASTRAVGTLVPSINTTDQTRFRATHRYLRNSGGTEGASIGMAILDLASSDDIKVRNPGALAPSDAIGNYATRSGVGGGLQLIRLPAGNFTHVERTVDAAECGISNINTTRPWLDSSGTWTTVTFNSEVRDDDSLYPGSGGDVTIKAGKKYAICWGLTPYSTDTSRHAYATRLQINGVNVQSGSSYQRTTASQGPPQCGFYLHEAGGADEVVRLQATQETEGADAGTPQVADAYLQVIELPDSAEWIHADNGATDSMTTALAGTGTWYDTPLSSEVRADGGANLSLDAANDAIQNDAGAALAVLAIGWHRWDRDSGASGTRKMPWSRWNNGGAAIGYGVAGAFSRGQQGGDDTFQAHYCSVATMDLADGADLTFQANEPASAANADMGIYASTNRNFLGVQVLDLSSLDAGGPAAQTLTGTLHTDTDTAFVGSLATGAVSITGSQHVDAGTLFAAIVTAGAVSIGGQLATDADNHFNGIITQTSPAQNITGSTFADPDSAFVGTLGLGSIGIAGSHLVDGDTMHIGTVQTTAINLVGSQYFDPDTLFSGQLSLGPVAIGGSFVPDGDAIFAGAATQGGVLVLGSAFLDPDTIFAGTVTAGNISIAGTHVSDPDAHFVGTLVADSAVGGSAFVDGDTFGTAILSLGPVTVGGSTLADPDTLYVGAITIDGGIGGSHIPAASVVYAGSIQPMPVTLGGSQLVDGDAFFTGLLEDAGLNVAGTFVLPVDVFFPATLKQTISQDIHGAFFHPANSNNVGAFGTIRGMALGERRLF